MPTRRPLSLASVADAPAEADRLRTAGYERAGSWDLTQTCGHLADWLGYAVNGDTPVPAALRPVFWVVRRTAGPRGLRRILDAGAMQPGVPTVKKSVPAANPDPAAEAAAVERLRTAAVRFDRHPGDYADSPIFGPLTRDQCRRLHAIHCAHHLGFLIPKDHGERGA